MPLLSAPAHAQAEDVALLISFVAMLCILAIAAMLEKTPDSRRQVSQHGHFQF